MALLDQIGAEGFTNRTDLESRTGFTASNSLVVEPLTVLNIAGEKWCTGSFAEVRRTWNTIYTSGPANEIEYHSAHYINDLTSIQRDFLFTLISPNNNTNGTAGVLLGVEIVPDPTSPTEDVLQVRYASQVSGQTLDIPTTVKVSEGSLFYIVLRMKGETTAGDDGEYEVWVNNELVASATGVQHSNTAAIAQFSNTNIATSTQAGSSSQRTYYRNLQVFDAWTTGSGVAPTLRHVIDGTPSDVTFEGGTTWTNEGGAVDEVTAISDLDDDTYLQTLEPDAHVVVGFDRPTDLATQPTIDAIVRARISRATSAPNTAAIATVTDNTGATESSSNDVVVTAIGTGRQNAVGILEGVGGTKLFVKITNGS